MSSSTTAQPTSSATSSTSTTTAAYHGKNKTGVWVGIIFGICVGVALLILLTTCLLYRRRNRNRFQRQQMANDRGTNIGEDQRSTLQEQATNSLGRNDTTVGSDGNDVRSLSETREDEEERTNRNALDAWKKGHIPPLNPDDMGPAEAQNAQLRRGTLAAIDLGPLNAPDNGCLGTLGLSYVNSRLAELEGLSRRSRDSNSQTTEDEASREEQAYSTELAAPSDGVQDGQVAHGNQNQTFLASEELSERIGYGPSKQVMGREGAEQITWWERR